MSFMMDEIEQQPAALERTLRQELPRIEAFRRRIADRPISMVCLVARGTSDNAAVFGRYLIEALVQVPTSLAAASVTTLYGSRPRWKDALVIALSQSGESTDTNLYVQAARESGALTVGITNEQDSSLTRLGDEVFLVHAGREKSVAATKTYTGQLLMLYLLAYALGAPVPPKSLERLPALADRALGVKKNVAALSERYRFMQQAVVVGRGLNYANAFEFALKMMETCYVLAERFSGADFLHGPIALVDRAFPVFVFAPPGPTRDTTLDTLRRLRALEAETILIGPARDTEAAALATRTIAVPSTGAAPRGCPGDLLTPVPYIIPAQMFCAFLAGQKGLDPDRPRTLTKVTRTI
jgi:glucosamine--fructose-6-phosphate aminotransferase (isomerizing)